MPAPLIAVAYNGTVQVVVLIVVAGLLSALIPACILGAYLYFRG